jgi:hypothetical protein
MQPLDRFHSLTGRKAAMKMSIEHMIFTLALFLAALACEDTANQPFIPAGTYMGTFLNPYATEAGQPKEPVRMELGTDRFTISGKNTLFYGHGEWSVEDGKVKFQDAMARNARYSWNWILNGDYTYQLIGKYLVLKKENSDGKVLEYQLERKQP